jgi:nucleotide-binding universal stress UspA family protein
MERALFVAMEERPATRELLQEAGKLAAGVGAELVVLSVIKEDDYAETSVSREELGKTEETGEQYSSYSIDQAEEDARTQAERIAGETLEEIEVEWTGLGAVGQPERTVLDVAEEQNVDHVFVVGKHRSPSGKAIFGDLAQHLVIDFDGPVTTYLPSEG